MLPILALAILTVGAPHPGWAFEITTSTPEQVTFGLSSLEPSWTAHPVRDGALVLHDLSLPGFVASAPAGSPRVPTRAAWLVVPPGMRAVLEVLDEDWQPSDGRRLMIEPTPVLERQADGEPVIGQILVLPGEPVPAGYELPDAARDALAKRGTSLPAGASLGEGGWWRGHRVVPVRVRAARVDPAGTVQEVLRGGRWRVSFVPDKAAAAGDIPLPQQRRRDNRGDERFGGTFLNGNLLGSVPTEAAHHGVMAEPVDKVASVRGEKRGTLLGFESRLAVTRTRLHKVTYASLRSRGLLPDVPIDESEVRLYQRRYFEAADDGAGAPYIEVEVPIHLVGEGDAFDGDDYFVFYGLRLRDDESWSADLGDGVITVPSAGDKFEQNNEFNVYWLAASTPDAGESWARMDETPMAAASGTLLTRYRRSDHLEEQVAFRESLLHVGSDRLYYNNHLATEVSVSVDPLYPVDPIPSAPPELRVAIAGFTNDARNLRLEFRTDDVATLVEDFTLATMSQIVRTNTLQTATLLGNSGRVGLTSNPAGNRVYSYLNWVELEYDALYRAVGNRLEFSAGVGTGARPIEVPGFDDADLALYDITDPRHPVRIALAASNIVADGDGWKLSIMPDQAAGETRIFAAAGDASGTGIAEYVTFRSTAAVDPVDPTETGGAVPDVLVVTHGDFRDDLDRWVEHRRERSGGALDIHVVEVQDIYDWYSGGLRDAWAIKRLANHAIADWGTWALVVVGDANENSLGKQVLTGARGWSTDWVPTHYHVQNLAGYPPELMASDKWYASLASGASYPTDTFPGDVTGPWDMITGRFPCNSVAELDVMIDKVITVENLAEDPDWRRRAILIGDDEWSNGLGIQALTELIYQPNELEFASSVRDDMAPAWAGGTAVALDTLVIGLKPYMDAGFPYELPNPDPRNLGAAREYCESVATDPLLGVLNQGGLLAHFQGHANPYVLTSELWIEDRRETGGRQDIARLANTGRPWVFMGMGCHIADWAQNPYRSDVVSNEASLVEKMLLRNNAGASAAYASSGFEFIVPNADFGRYIFDSFVTPPVADAAGGAIRSRWVTGEIFWGAEAAIRAAIPFSPYTQMVSQYVLLGDPLMVLDAGPAQAVATLHGETEQELSGQAEIAAVDATNLRSITVAARDEAGIDRLQVLDSTGADLTDQIATEVIPDGAVGHGRVDYELQVPVRPFDHSLTVRVYDTGGPLPDDRHWELVLDMPQTATFMVGGEPIDPATFVFLAEQPVPVRAQVASSAVLQAGMEMTLTSATLALSDINFDFGAKGRELDVTFTATAAETDPDAAHSVILTIDGLPTELVVQAGSGDAPLAGIGRVYNFPNPMRDATRFVYESDVAGASGVIRVFSVAGRTVARIPFVHGTSSEGIIPWNGRDAAGDELANGTYLYRIELEGPDGAIVSDMQRLVVMR